MVHCFMKITRQLQPNEVEQDIKDIIHNKFNDMLSITQEPISNSICMWNIGFDNKYNFPVCLKTNNQLEFMHPDNAWARWAQLIVEQELATKYKDVKVFDEEYPKKNPILVQYETFIAFLESTMMHHSSNWKKAIIEIEISKLPEKLKNLK